MTTEEQIKYRRELSQIYLIITPLLIAIKQGEFPQQLFLTINQTNVTINNSTENTDTTFLYLFLLLFLIMTLSFYITPFNNNLMEKLTAVLIGISFSMILYFCLFEQMIKTNIETVGLTQSLLIITEAIVGIILCRKLRLKDKNYQFCVSNWEKGLILLASVFFFFVLSSLKIDQKSLLLLAITLVMEIITTLAFIMPAPVKMMD